MDFSLIVPQGVTYSTFQFAWPLCNLSLAQQEEKSKGTVCLLPTVPVLHVVKELMFLLIFCMSAGCAFWGSSAGVFAGRQCACTAEVPWSQADAE